MKSLENLRALLYSAIEKGKVEEIIDLSRKFDEAIVEEMKRTSMKNSTINNIFTRMNDET